MNKVENRQSINIKNSKDVVLGDVVINNHLDMPAEEQVELLASIAKIVEKQGDETASALYQALQNELQERQPRKSVLQSLWSGLASAIPVLEQTADIALKVAKLWA